MAGQHPLEQIGCVLEQVESVCYLLGLRSPVSGCRGIRAGTVAADDLGFGMVSKPSTQTFGRAVGQQIAQAMAFPVHQHRAIAAAFLEGPVVSPHDTDRRLGSGGHPNLANPVKKRIGTDQKAEFGGQARSGLAAESIPDQGEGFLKPVGFTGITRCQLRHRRSEDGALTGPISAKELAHSQMKADGHSVPGQIRQSTPIAAVNPSGGLPAHRTASDFCCGSKVYPQSIGGRREALDLKASAGGKQSRRCHALLYWFTLPTVSASPNRRESQYNPILDTLFLLLFTPDFLVLSSRLPTLPPPSLTGR